MVELYLADEFTRYEWRGLKPPSNALDECSAPLLCHVAFVHMVSHCRTSSKVRLVLRPVSRGKIPISRDIVVRPHAEGSKSTQCAPINLPAIEGGESD